MAEKGLGAGLGALFGDAALYDGDTNDFVYLPIAKVEPRKDQPRNVFDEEGLQQLSDSISEHGILQPITVRELSGGYYQIVSGERRWRAARLAGLKEVPVRIVAADDRKATELAMVENLQREGLNPIEEAMGYRQLMAEYDMTQDEVAQRVSKSRPVVANALRLLTLPEKVLKMLENGELSSGAARALLSLDGDDAILAAAETVASKKLNVRETEALVKKLKSAGKAKKKPAPAGIVVDYMKEVERRLSDELGRKVRITDGKKRGRIEIDYYGRDDFEAVCEALSALKLGKGRSKK